MKVKDALILIALFLTFPIWFPIILLLGGLLFSDEEDELYWMTYWREIEKLRQRKSGGKIGYDLLIEEER